MRVAMLLFAAIVTTSATVVAAPAADKATVTVLYFDNDTGDTSLASWARG